MSKNRSVITLAVLAVAGLAVSAVTATPAYAASCNTSQAIAAETIAGNFSTVDRAYNGTQDGLVSRTDLEIVAQGSGYPNYLRNSARVLLEGDFFRQIDTAAQGGRADGLLSVGDLNAACG